MDDANRARPRRTVQVATDRLRERIFTLDPGSRIGSLTDLAQDLGVGIVTVQQSARILEHEGVLEVRRGPGGGYYGRRPDAASLERSLSAYMRMQPREEMVDMTSLLFNELCAAAANCEDNAMHAELRLFGPTLDACAREADIAKLELEFQDLLLRMVDRPLFDLLTRVSLQFAGSASIAGVERGLVTLGQWKTGRRRIIDAILRGDRDLAYFEAKRSNRSVRSKN